MIYGGLADGIQKMIERLVSIAPKGSIFFDFGVNDGEMSQHINNEIVKHLDCYTYYGFEPDTRFKQSYTNRFAAFPNIKVVEKAIGAETGKAQFHLSFGYEKDKNGVILHSFNASSSLRQPTERMLNHYPHMKFEPPKPVDIITLDDFAAENKIDSIHLIWADIQGAELDMIKGGTEILKKTSYLYTEYQSEEMYAGCGIGLDAILELLPGWEVVEDFGSDVLLKNTERTQGC